MEFQKVINEQQRIDVLINNAGFAIWGAVEDTSYEQAKRQFEVNLFGLAEITKDSTTCYEKPEKWQDH